MNEIIRAKQCQWSALVTSHKNSQLPSTQYFQQFQLHLQDLYKGVTQVVRETREKPVFHTGLMAVLTVKILRL